VYKPSIRFLECIEDCVLLQMLDMKTRNSALLDLELTNQELLNNIIANIILRYSNHNIVEFKMLLSTLETSSRLKSQLQYTLSPAARDSMGSIHGRVKELMNAGSYSRTAS